MVDRPIILFDSGIGGLTVLREARVLMPDRRFVYVADDAAFPYGDWEEDALKARIVELAGKLIAEHDPLVFAIPCNTASTLVLEDLRASYPSTPFVGTVPAIKPAAERTSTGLISVLATPGTVKRAYTRNLIQSFASKCHVRLVGSQNLARFAELHIRGEAIDDQTIRDEIAPCFIEHEGMRTDIVVLACTHYPFLANVFRRLAPWPVDWLDPAEAIARRILALLNGEPAGRGGHDIPDRAIFTSGRADFAAGRLMQGFGLQMMSRS
jgi:glutamate racemase